MSPARCLSTCTRCGPLLQTNRQAKVGLVIPPPSVAPPHGRLEAAAWLGTTVNGRTAARTCPHHGPSGTVLGSDRLPGSCRGAPPVTQKEPPVGVVYGLEEALELLAAIEDALEVLADTDHLVVVAEIEHEVLRLHRKLGLDRPFGGDDGH